VILVFVIFALVAARNQISRKFRPTHIPGLIVWFDASDPDTLIRNAGGKIIAWRDKSGNGNDMVVDKRFVPTLEIKRYDHALSEHEIDVETKKLAAKWGIDWGE
ncbi:hypothetical protein LCGC14_2309280, partial [marine sediment metagenome]